MAYAKNLFDKNFIEYASYVIKDRAIPSVEDGLKPVQRRILHTLMRVDDGKFHKVANVVGHSMQFHPHGDASIYSALVVLANKDLFIEKQGNFGNIVTGDPASAARYIECRLTPLAKKVLYNPELTQWIESYDGRNKEPLFFPAKIPVLLIQGAEGIAVGMSTRILPHNRKEVLEALKMAIAGKKTRLYPDFPTGGLIEVSEYADGMGKVRCRAKLDTSDPKKIIIREVPFGINTEGLIASIENATKKGKIKIAGISDFTTEKVEIEIKLQRGVYADDVIDALYAFTDCEISLSVNCLVIKEDKPCLMTISELMDFHARALIDILKRELKLEEKQLLDKKHARTLEKIFVQERIYKKIEQMKSQAGVMNAVKKGFEPFKEEIKREITDEDVERLLKIPIRRISLYDMNKLKDEIRQIDERLKEIRHHLKHLKEYATAFIDEILSEADHSWERRTQIESFEKIEVREAAVRDKKLYYDAEKGFAGYNLNQGDYLFDVSVYDRIILIDHQGRYQFMDVPEKFFIDKGMLYCSLADKEILDKTIFSIIYQNEKKQAYVKRFQIDGFIMKRIYESLPKGCTVLDFTIAESAQISVKYETTPRMKIKQEDFQLEDFLVKGKTAGGTRISSKAVKKINIKNKK